MTDETPDAYEAELRDLGFPEAAIREAVRARDEGLFALEPSPEMVERTAEACGRLAEEHVRGSVRNDA